MTIILTLILGFVLRIFSLNQSLWLDEATTALVAQMNLNSFFNSFMIADFHPPLYYLLIRYWIIVFGNSEVFIRIPSVLFGVATIYLVYLIAKELRQKWPLVPALFLATSGLHIYYSQEARMYSMACFFASLIIWFYIKQKWLLFSISVAALFLTDYLSLLILPSLFVYILVYSRSDLKKFIYSLIPFFIVFLLWLPTFWRQLSNGLSVQSQMSGWWSILGTVSFKNIMLIPTKFIFGRITIEDKNMYFLLAASLIAIYVFNLLKAKNKLVLSWFFVSLISGILVSFFIPTLSYFRYLFILPAFYLLITENSNKYFLIFVLIVNLTISSIYLFNPDFHRENWRELSSRIGQDKIIMPAYSQREALTYYGKESNVIQKENITDTSSFWLSRYAWNVFDPTDSTRKYVEQLGYNWSEELNLNGLVFWRYTK